MIINYINTPSIENEYVIFTSVATGGDTSPNDPKDMIIHESANGEDRLMVTLAANIAMLNSTGTANGWDVNWGSAVAGLALTSQALHPLAKLQRLVAIGDKQNVTTTNLPVVHTIDGSDTVITNALIFPAEYTVRHIITNSNRFWIGLQHDFNGNARIIEWDGFSLTYNKEYDLLGSFPLTGFVVNDIPYFITEKGFIFKFSGGGFVKVQDFMLQERDMIFSSALGEEDTINAYGAYADGHLVYINAGIPVIDDTSDADSLVFGVLRGRSGIWIYNTQNNNLYHHMGIGQHASSGTDIDYGHPYLDNPGVVLTSSVGIDRILIASGSVFTGGASWLAGTANGIYRMQKGVILSSSEGRNRGYIITPYMPIGDVEAMWEALWVKFKRFILDEGSSASSNRIIVKWRTTDPLFEADAQDVNNNVMEYLNAEGTWVNTTSFTAQLPVGVSVGDEVEVLTGDNAGCSFNISALSATPDNDASITVTIDEAAPTSSTDTFLCRIDNWNSDTAISSVTVGNQKVPFTTSGETHGEFIQLKIELRGYATQLDSLIPVLKSKTKPQQT